MPLINWNMKYSVGNNLIDSQHQKLVSLINELHDAMKEARGKEVVGKILSETINYTYEHFRDEEKLMENAKFPGLPLHKIEHKKLTDQVTAFYESYKNQNALVTIELMQFLKGWLINHIEGMDMKYKGSV